MDDDIQYFLKEENQYNQNTSKRIFDSDYTEFDSLDFLHNHPFEKGYENMLLNKDIIFGNNPFRLTESEKLIFFLLVGTYSYCFRDDYKQPLLQRMTHVLENLLDKLNPCKSVKVYRYCKDHDKTDFNIGDEWLCPFSLTCRTSDDWGLNNDENLYEIKLLQPSQTRARNLYEVHNHGADCNNPEYQVNFKKNTLFRIVNIINMSNNGKKFVMEELLNTNS